MARIFHPKVVTANDLLEGDVIYLTADDQWSRNLDNAELLEDAEAADIRLAYAEMQQDRLVGPYLADAFAGDDGNPEPVHFREAFRTRGPSNYTKHGKQAEL